MPTIKVEKYAGLFNNSRGSDIKLIQIYNGERKEYFAHRAILCNASPYFMAALMGEFKEASEPEVELHDDDPKAFEIFLRLVYLGGYDQRVINEHLENETTEEPTMITKLCMPIHISILADKYEVFGLLDPASREFFQQIKIMVNKITVYKNSYMSHYEPKLLLKGIKKALELYYTNHVGEPEPIGKIIAFTCMVNLQFYIKDQIIDIVKKYPSFGADWVAYQWEVGAIPRYSIACQSCVDVSSHTNTSKSSCSSYCINRLEQTLFKEE